MFRVSGNQNLRRVLAGALVLALALGGFAALRSVGDAHAATSCTKHVKRVVKHVKRHGKAKKIVRLRPYWSCREVAESVAPVAVPPAPSPTPAPETAAQPPEPTPNAVSIATNDHTNPYEYVPSHKSVRSGRLTVQLNNMASEDEHNMDMERIGAGGEPEGPLLIDEVAAGGGGASETVSVEVQPGTYKMWCTIGHHAEHGMTTTITVE